MSAHEEWDITCFHPHPWSKFTWVVMNLSACFLFVFGVYMVYVTWLRIHRINTFVKLLCTIIILLFNGAEILWAIHITSSYFCIFRFKLWLDLGLVALFFYQIGLAVLYLVFVYRLNEAFKGTMLALSRYGFIVFIIGFCLQSFFASMVMYYHYAFPPQKWRYALTMIISFGITNSFFATVLLVVFFKKIIILSDATLLNVAIRIVLCATLGLLSTWIGSILSFVRILSQDTEIAWTTHVMSLSLDCAVNLFSLYLQFSVGEKVFYKICGQLAGTWQAKLSKKRRKATMSCRTTDSVVSSAPNCKNCNCKTSHSVQISIPQITPLSSDDIFCSTTQNITN